MTRSALEENVTSQAAENLPLGPDEKTRGGLMAVAIRPAVEADEATIRAMVRTGRVNPRSIRWPRFLVAEDGDLIVGIQQVEVHRVGTREVALRVVHPEFRRRGISTELIFALLPREPGTLYLQCNEHWTRYYERFGFHRVKPSELPTDLRKEHRISRLVVAMRSLFLRRRLSIIPIKRDAWSNTPTIHSKTAFKGGSGCTA